MHQAPTFGRRTFKAAGAYGWGARAMEVSSLRPRGWCLDMYARLDRRRLTSRPLASPGRLAELSALHRSVGRE